MIEVVKVVENTINEVNLKQYSTVQWIGWWSLLGDGSVVVVCRSDHHPIHLPASQVVHQNTSIHVRLQAICFRDICKIILNINRQNVPNKRKTCT